MTSVALPSTGQSAMRGVVNVAVLRAVAMARRNALSRDPVITIDEVSARPSMAT